MDTRANVAIAPWIRHHGFVGYSFADLRVALENERKERPPTAGGTTDYLQLSNRPVIPSTPSQVGAEPAGLSAPTLAALSQQITTAVAGVIAGAPQALDTLLEIAQQLQLDETGATALAELVATKQTAAQVSTAITSAITAKATADAATYATKGELAAAGGGVQYVQLSPAAQWSIPHSFGRRPSVALYDAAGALIFADVVSTSSLVLVTYANPTAGSAVLT